jgi:phosphotransferase system IIA component
MKKKLQKYIITLLVDNREWNSQPIEGNIGNLQKIIDEAFEQHRISRFFTIRPKIVEFKRATLLK